MRGYKFIPLTTISIILSLTLGVYLWPLWTGDVFRLGNKSLATRVPQEYFDLNDFLNQDSDFFRTLHLPIVAHGENYDWEIGYVGSEPSLYILDKPSISRWSWVPFCDELIKSLNRLVMSPGFEKILSLLNVKYIVLHKDISKKARYLNTPSFYEKFLTDKIKPASPPLNTNSQKEILCLSRGGEIGGWQILLGKSNFSEVGSSTEPFPSLRYLDTLSKEELHFRYNVDPHMTDWSGMDFLRINLKTNRPTPIRIDVCDSSSDSIVFWNGCYESIYSIHPYETGQWKEFILPLQSPSSFNKGDPRQVESFNLVIPVLDNPGEFQLDIGPVFLEKGEAYPNEFVRFRKKFDALELYEVSEDLLLPHIYPVNHVVWFHDFNHFVDTLPEERFQLKKELVLFESQKDEFPLLNNISLPQERPNLPVLQVQKINPTHYKVDVKNANAPFFLVFHELYHPDWEGKIGDKPQVHFRGNIYGNVWYITKNGNYTVELQFLQQKSFEKYLKISSVFFILFSIGILGYGLKSKMLKKSKSR